MQNWASTLTVTEAATSDDLVSLQAVKDELRISGNSDDARIQRWIDECSAAIESYTRRRFPEETVTETFYRYGPGTSVGMVWTMPTRVWSERLDHPRDLVLARYPVTELLGISEDGTDTDPTLVTIDAQSGLLMRMTPSGTPYVWTSGKVVVSYTAGYLCPSHTPPDLSMACYRMLTHRQSAWGRDPMLRRINLPGVQEEEYWVNTGSAGSNPGISAEVQSLLDPYRDYRL